MAGTDARRFEALDSLRGIAALIVLIYHLSMTYGGFNLYSRRMIPIRIFFAGQDAVFIFFALSGFVLFLSMEKRDDFAYFPYIVRRMIRLYIPLAVTVLISALLYFFVQPVPIIDASMWLNSAGWTDTPDASTLTGHLALLDPDRFQSLNSVMWSLVHEIRISIIFPLLAFSITKSPRITVLLTAFISAMCFIFFDQPHSGNFIDVFHTGRYLFLFSAGAYLAHVRSQICQFMAERSPWPMLITAWALLSVFGSLAPLAATIAAILVLTASFASKGVRHALSWPVLIWLGRISYSLYLVHMLVILTFMHTLSEQAPHATLLALMFIFSIVIAELFYRLVERPSMSIGRRAAAWTKRLTAATS